MNIGLIDVDSTIPNLALMKISAYHKHMGDDITLIKDKTISTRLIPFDIVYVSCIFEENKEIATKISKQFSNSKLGGVGVNNEMLPYIVDHIMPDYSLYPDIDYSLGFTTRGCIRNCDFCKVRQHEGNMRENCDIYEFWNKEHKKIILLDNNILALPKHFKKIAKQLKENKLQVDFNQGLDHRLLTPELCKILLELKHIHEIRFAFDKPEYKKTVLKAIEMLKEAGLKDWGARWYVYVGVNDTFDTVYNRMKLLQDHKQSVYVMRDKRIYNKPEFIALASWGNTMGAFKLATLKEVLESSERMKPYRKIFEKVIKDERKKGIGLSL